MQDTPLTNQQMARDKALVQSMLLRATTILGLRTDRTELNMETAIQAAGSFSLSDMLSSAGDQFGLSVVKVEELGPEDVLELLSEGCPVFVVSSPTKCHLLRGKAGRLIEANLFENDRVSLVSLRRREIIQLLANKSTEVLVVKAKLDCDTISANPVNEHRGHEEHISPLTRFFGLLRMDRRDVRAIILFSLVSGILSLAAPLAVESLVNVVSWGIYIQPLLVLAFILLGFLSLSAALNVLQSVVVEMIQRRQFVRIVCDLAHRFPRTSRQELSGVYPRELANRLFDIMTIQKATAELLIDGVSIVLTTVIGLVLLGFYHPFLLGFDLLLVLLMTVVTVVLGRGAIQTSISESQNKYATFHWLQDVIDFPEAFRVNGGEGLAIERASQLASEYVVSRKKHFQILIRQLVFAAGLQALALTALLGLGGWLVIAGELTLGQLVASELVVATVVGAFAKAGKTIEKFYDLMAGVDKVGHLIDLKAELDEPIVIDQDGPLKIGWQPLKMQHGYESLELPASFIAPGSIHAIVTREHASLISRVLGGILVPDAGIVEVEGIDVKRLAMGSQRGRWVGLAGRFEIFHGSISENVHLGRSEVGRSRVREVLQDVGLWEEFVNLPQGLFTVLQTDGYPLSESQRVRLTLARAVASRPRVLIVDGLLDRLRTSDQDHLLQFLRKNSSQWTTVLITGDPLLAQKCDDITTLEA